MAITGGITIDLDRFQKQLEADYKGFLTELDAEMSAAMVAGEAFAVRQVPVDTGALKNSIQQKKLAPLDYELVAPIRYAAYVEFGTGAKVNVPAGYEEYALQFKGTRQVPGMRARPYLIPGAQLAEREIEKALQRL